MLTAPFSDDAVGLLRKPPFNDVSRRKRNQSLLALIFCMEVRRRMVVVIHADGDPEECRNDRHVES